MVWSGIFMKIILFFFTNLFFIKILRVARSIYSVDGNAKFIWFFRTRLKILFNCITIQSIYLTIYPAIKLFNYLNIYPAIQLSNYPTI